MPRPTAPFDARILDARVLDQAVDAQPDVGHREAAPDEGSRVHLGRRVARAAAEKRVGTVLSGRWRVDRLIDTGGMAQVYAATHRNGRAVAVKVLRPELAAEPELVQRFLREGYVANKVQHPGAVAILDDDIAPDGAPFLVMELLQGRTLRARLGDEGPIAVDDALRIAADVLSVLASAHERGIVHRDIKPENLFETSEGVIKVLDFGIARLRELAMGGAGDAEGSAEGEARGHPSTQSGRTMGTIGYMAPEQARGEPDAVDARSDLWAVGATLYTLVTDRVLHDAPTTNAGLLLAMTVPVAPMQELAPGLPTEVRVLLDTALAFDRTSRFADCGAMAAAVHAARGLPVHTADADVRSSDVETEEPPQTPRAGFAARRRVVVWGLTACTVVAAFALIVQRSRSAAPVDADTTLDPPHAPPAVVESASPDPPLPTPTGPPIVPPTQVPSPTVTSPPRAAPPLQKVATYPVMSHRSAPSATIKARPGTPPGSTLDPLGPRR